VCSSPSVARVDENIKQEYDSLVHVYIGRHVVGCPVARQPSKVAEGRLSSVHGVFRVFVSCSVKLATSL
jgi:hypothetical protein